MAGVLNKTARQYNLKAMDSKGSRVVVRLVPGFNVVNNEHWEALVPKKGPANWFVKELTDKGFLEFGGKQDDMQLEMDTLAPSVSKSEPVPKRLPLEKN